MTVVGFPVFLYPENLSLCPVAYHLARGSNFSHEYALLRTVITLPHGEEVRLKGQEVCEYLRELPFVRFP